MSDKSKPRTQNSKGFRLKGITRRWILGVFSVIVVILTIISVAASFMIRRYYYGLAENAISSKIQMSVVQAFFEPYLDSTDAAFELGAKEFVENFSYRYLMDVWIIDKNGRVLVTSKGFSVGDVSEIPDFVEAIDADAGEGVWTGRNSNGEQVLTKTYIINDSDNDPAGAIRLIVSMEDLLKRNTALSAMIAVIAFIAASLVAVSGRFFIGTIVRPVNRINRTARQIAEGDFSARVQNPETNDEISELCDTVNNMAEALAKSDRMKNDFISTVSHELRTPLTAIRGWAETIRGGLGEDSDPVTVKGMDIIVSETDRLGGMVEDLLDFSRMESGRMVKREAPVDALAVLRGVCDIFTDTAAKVGIDLMNTVPGAEVTAPMMADVDLIRQVFTNILDNAVKYTGEGGKITVFAEVLAGQLMVSVADTGCGIAPDDLPHVTEKFYKANMSVRGSGIGLAVVDEIVRMHDGAFDIASALGVGTVVTVVLPVDNELSI